MTKATSDQAIGPSTPIEPIFDTTPHPAGEAPVDPLVYDASIGALRRRTVNFAAKRYVDMMFVTGLDRKTADEHFRVRAAQPPGGLDGRAALSNLQAEARAAFDEGRLTIQTDEHEQKVVVRWRDPRFPEPVIATAIARAGYGGILLGEHTEPRFALVPVPRRFPGPGLPWPVGDAVETPPVAPTAVATAMDRFFAPSPGLYSVVIARPDRVLAERHSAFSGPDRATPSWSMTKSITSTLIGRLVREGWLASPYDPAPAPMWRDPRGVHRAVTLDHLLRMRSGLGFPVIWDDGRVTLGFENSAVYQDACDAFEAAQRSIVAATPGAVFRYVNSGMNVLGSIIRDQIERHHLPYHETVYELLVNRLGMRSYQHSADLAGNFIASGAGFATARDYAKLGVLYLQDGIWNRERLLPEGWVDYALTATHTGTTYAAGFRTNTGRVFPDLPEDAAWALGASDQRIFILRRQRLTVAVTNESDYPVDLGALNRLVAAAIDHYA
jgi:CubicO group peptidase (beta-lactamase class C family)